MIYEYKVVPAPTKGLKAKGLKTTADRFSLAFETAINEYAKEGWEFLRAETLPSEEREGLMSKTTMYQNVLVFKRPAQEETEVEIAGSLPPPMDEPEAQEDDTESQKFEAVEATVSDQEAGEVTDGSDGSLVEEDTQPI